MSCCDEFSRATLFHRAASAGRGLPGIEPGMPEPAGTGLSRRTFLLRGAGVALSVYGASKLSLRALDEGVAQAAPPERVLVSLYLAGGADTISVLYPALDPAYARLRPTLAIPPAAGATFPDDPRMRWHPAAGSLATLYGEGKLAALPAVGYTNADQSHFTSRHYYEVGATDAHLRTGWLGRYLDLVGTPDNPLQGLSLDGALAPPLASAKAPVGALSSAGGYTFAAPGVGSTVAGRLQEALAPLGAAPATDATLAAARRVVAQVDSLRDSLVPFRSIASPVAYPDSRDAFPSRLAGLAALLGAGLPIRVVAMRAYGQYDTHSDQPEALASGLQLTADSLLAFQRDLEARGLADRVVTLVWSEFGRRARENASRGTDHGAAGVGFVVGNRVVGQVVGGFPSLADLDELGNLKPTADFRGVYAALLEQWLGFDAGGVIPDASSFARPALIR
jgi:uncharacterized protein (DUF1501 family)